MAFADDIRRAAEQAGYAGLGTPSELLRNRAFLQVVLNVLLFLPFGVFVRLITHRGVVVATALGFAVSLLIEVTQLTGVWGVYPCAYRLFDVDDLLTNTLGAFLGALVSYPYAARRRRRLGTARRRLPTTVSVGRRLAATLSDVLFVVLAGTAAAALWRGYLVFAEDQRPATDSAVDDRAAGGRAARGAGAAGAARRQDRRRARRRPAHQPGVVRRDGWSSCSSVWSRWSPSPSSPCRRRRWPSGRRWPSRRSPARSSPVATAGLSNAAARLRARDRRLTPIDWSDWPSRRRHRDRPEPRSAALSPGFVTALARLPPPADGGRCRWWEEQWRPSRALWRGERGQTFVRHERHGSGVASHAHRPQHRQQQARPGHGPAGAVVRRARTAG